MKFIILPFVAFFLFSCSNQKIKIDGERIPSSDLKILYSPKLLGYIYVGKTKSFVGVAPSGGPNYVLKEDLERDEISNEEGSPIGDFMLKPGSVIKLRKETLLYLKAALILGHIDPTGSFALKAGTKVRILSYESTPIAGDTTAVVEVIN
ncbi:MAG: hypothetical protein ACXVLQ_05195 [Bacteriovorax sp.]